MPTSRSPFGVNIAPLPFPDFQTDINKQLSFWNTMQQMQRRAAGISGGGGRVPRDENGLTPYQRMQREDKLRKEQQKAAEAEAKKNVMLGLDPVSKEPIIYRNESGQNLTQKDRDRLLADELQRRLKNAAGQDVELNKALGELNSGTELSTQRRSELQRVIRDRTKALGRNYGIDDRATFDAIIGPSKQVLDEQRQALRNDSFLDTVWAGMRKGGNALYYAATMPFMSDAERLEAAEQMRKEQEAITRSSPTLQERALVEAEAARKGKDVGYMQAAQANLASNIGASVADTVTSFAPAIAAGMIPVVGTYAAPVLAGGIGAGLNQVSQAARVEADPNLTEAQKQQALSYSDPGFVGTTVLGGATGAMFPGSIGSGIARGAGSAAFRRAAAAGPINPATVPGLTGRALRAGARATERAQAPRSLAALSRDVPVNMAENAGLMAANTVGANMAYNASVGQPLTQGAMEGVGRAAMEGAIIGVPFGVGRTLRRRAAPTAQATTEGTVSPTGEPANTQPVSIFEQAMKADTAAQEWKRDLLKTVVNPRKVKTEDANKLIAEYLDTVDTTVDGWRDEMSARLVSIDDLPRWNKMNDNSAAALRKVVDTWKGALDDGTIAEKIASNYQRPAEGESRLASYVGELERVRAKRAAGQGSGNDSKVATNPADSASDVASGDSVQGDASNSETPGRRTSGTTAPHIRAIETDAAALAQAGILPSTAKNKPASSGSTGTGGKSSGNGTGKPTSPTVGRDGSTGDANATSGGEQSIEPIVISIGEPQKVGATKRPIVTQDGVFTDSNFMKYDATFVRLGSKAKPQWFWKPEGSKKNYKVSPEHNERLEKAYQAKLGEAKGTNPKDEVKESRFLPRQQYSSAGTSRRQIPESFKKIAWTQGTRNLDIGAGAFELGTDYLRSRGVENTPFDPYNRTRDVNNAALDTLRNGEKYDTVTVANLLNVVQEPEIRDNIIKQAAHSVKPDGKAYFQVYESDRSGVGRQTKTGGTDDNWQNARTLKSYQPDIERHFGKVESKDGMLIASEPKDPGPVEWQLNEAGDTVREQRGFHGGADKERRIAEGSALSPEVIDAYLTTPAERKLAATLNRTDVDSPIFPSLLQQFTDTMLKKFKGIPNRSVLLSSNYADVSEQATGWYDRRSQRIGMNPENIFDRFDTVENALHTMSHEIDHDVLDTRVPRSVRTAISTDAYNAAETGIARVAKRAYSDMNRTAQGEEIFVETAARENPFLDPAELGTTPREYAEDIVSLTLDGLGAGSADSAAAAREMVHFLATNAPSDIGNFGDIATTVLTSNKDIVEAFTNPNVQTTGLMQELATDYRNKVQEAGLKGYSKETMADYLSAVLDPRTSMDVYARTTKLC